MSGAAVWLALGGVGGIGAIARFLLDGAVSRRLASRFPCGTLAVNVSGTLALGILVGATLDGDGYRLAGTGFLGAFTTFSTWTLESYELGEGGELALGWLNIALSLASGLLCAWLGRQIGQAL